MIDLAELVADWDVPNVAVGVEQQGVRVAYAGDPTWSTRLASLTKLFTAWAGLVAVEEGTITLDEEIDDPRLAPGVTFRHLLGHTSGVGFDEPKQLAAPGTRRIYSNVGIEAAADAVAARAAMPFAEYMQVAVFDPLGMAAQLRGSPAHAAFASVDDVLRFMAEVRTPRLIASETAAVALTPSFGAIPGVLPGFGRFDDNAWGLGFEIRGAKQPHWTAPANSRHTLGHFGGAGTFVWWDPDVDVVCCCLTDRPYGEWANKAWPELSAAVLDRFA